MPAPTALLLLAPLAVLSTAQVLQDDWINPSLPDLSVTITEGVPYTLTWDDSLQNWFAQYAPQAVTTNVTLWIASVQLSYAHIIQQYVDVTRTREITWTPSLPASEYAQDQNWNFRFTPANYTSLSTPGAANEEIDSPQFVYKGPSTSSSSSSSSSASPTSATSTSSTTFASATSTPSSSSSPTPSPSPSSSSLSTGAIAGIALGAAGAALLAAALVYLLARLRRMEQRTTAATATPGPFDGSAAGYMSSSNGAAEGTMVDSVRPYYAGGGGSMAGSTQAAPVETQELPEREIGELEGNGGEWKAWNGGVGEH